MLTFLSGTILTLLPPRMVFLLSVSTHSRITVSTTDQVCFSLGIKCASKVVILKPRSRFLEREM